MLSVSILCLLDKLNLKLIKYYVHLGSILKLTLKVLKVVNLRKLLGRQPDSTFNLKADSGEYGLCRKLEAKL